MSGPSDPLLDLLYAHVTQARRRWAEHHPERRRRLARPVVSVGNLSVGGTGKTPVVAAIAQWLVAQGERPAILSRGYARADAVDGVVVVSDGASVRADLAVSGDEPLMLARQVPAAVVCVSPDRYLAGTLAETTLGCTVHLLDDGFQQMEVARDLDVLVTTLGEIPGGRVLPVGRLREPMDAASRAHVLVVSDATASAAAAEAWTLGISQSCGAVRELGSPILIGSRESGDSRVLAVAGIAHPQRFADSLRAAGWQVAGLVAFADHHRYTRADLDRIAAAAARAGVDAVLTTDKDAVRFEAIGPARFALYRVPLAVRFEPADVLFDSVREAIDRRARAARGGAR